MFLIFWSVWLKQNILEQTLTIFSIIAFIIKTKFSGNFCLKVNWYCPSDLLQLKKKIVFLFVCLTLDAIHMYSGVFTQRQSVTTIVAVVLSFYTIPVSFADLDRSATTVGSNCTLLHNNLPWLWFDFGSLDPHTQGSIALRPIFEKLFTGPKFWRKAKKFGVGRKAVYEIDPRCH